MEFWFGCSSGCAVPCCAGMRAQIHLLPGGQVSRASLPSIIKPCLLLTAGRAVGEASGIYWPNPQPLACTMTLQSRKWLGSWASKGWPAA
jgi:hypothetical protein